jgi:maltooligosyltrehalose trehalohydrolase
MHERVSAEEWRAASVVLMTAPMTPLLFMGQEWAASTPFHYFTDLEPVLGAGVTRGRRQEFAGFPEFAGPAAERIPDPQAEDTFTRSRLKWDEARDPKHSRALALYRQLLVLRREHQALAASDSYEGHAVAPDDQSIVLRRSDAGETFWIVARLKSSGEIDLAEAAATLGDRVDPARLELVLDTEHAEFTADPEPIHLSGTIRFGRAGAVILRA